MPEVITNTDDESSLKGQSISRAPSATDGSSVDPATSPSLSSLRVCVRFASAPEPIVKSYQEVLGTFGFTLVSNEGDADVVVTNRIATSQIHLRSGQHVVHLTRETKHPLYDSASPNLQQHQEYGVRYHCVDTAPSSFPLRGALSALRRALNSSEARVPPIAAEITSTLARSKLSGLRILALDNSAHNRAAAQHQFGATNELTVLESYMDAINSLRKGSIDLAIIDLLMPPENYMLGPEAFSRVVGTEFPAGIFVALCAAKQGVKKIFIVSDSSHHDDPATALMSSLFADPLLVEGGSKITFCRAHTVKMTGIGQPVKDWDASISRHVSK